MGNAEQPPLYSGQSVMDWYLMKEDGIEFWTQCESREQALEDAAMWNAEVIRQATIVEAHHLEND